MALTLAWVQLSRIHAVTSVERVLLSTQIVVGLRREITVRRRSALLRVGTFFDRSELRGVKFSK